MTAPTTAAPTAEAERGHDEERSAREIARLMAAQGKFSLTERRRILSVLLPAQNRKTVVRFAIMLGLSVAVAVMGLSANSSAVVIGAMLIAPLMTPILTFAAAVGLGLPRRASQAGFLVVLGSLGAVAFAVLLSFLLPEVALGSEILGRTSPDIRDLVVAIAAGAAGAYATAREDASAALPGVAVAVALVPPLATTGIVLQAGRTDLAEGSILLFLVNLLAIVVSALLVFVMTGVVPTIRLCLRSRKLSLIVVATVALMVMIGIPLTARSIAAAEESAARNDVRAEVDRWLGNAALEVDDLDVVGQTVTVALIGSEPPPLAFDLAFALTDEIGPDAEVVVRWAQRDQGVARADSPPSTDLTPQEAALAPVEAWLEDANSEGLIFELLEILADGDSIDVVVGGPVAPPASRTLANEIAENLGRPVTVTVRWLQQLAVDGSSLTPQQRIERLTQAWVGARTGIRVLDVRVNAGGVGIDLATDGAPAGLDVLDRLASESAGDVPVVIRSVPLTTIDPTPVSVPQPSLD